MTIFCYGVLGHSERYILFSGRSCQRPLIIDLGQTFQNLYSHGAFAVHDDQGVILTGKTCREVRAPTKRAQHCPPLLPGVIKIYLSAVWSETHAHHGLFHVEGVDHCSLVVHADLSDNTANYWLSVRGEGNTANYWLSVRGRALQRTIS